MNKNSLSVMDGLFCSLGYCYSYFLRVGLDCDFLLTKRILLVYIEFHSIVNKSGVISRC